jgi:hypothetical protein
MATQTSPEAAGALLLEKPAPSETQSVVKGPQPIKLAFDASEAQVALVGGDVVLRFPDGATLIIAAGVIAQDALPLSAENLEIPRPGDVQLAVHEGASSSAPAERPLTLDQLEELLSIAPAAGPAEAPDESSAENQGGGGEFETPLLHELTSLEALGLLAAEDLPGSGAPFALPNNVDGGKVGSAEGAAEGGAVPPADPTTPGTPGAPSSPGASSPQETAPSSEQPPAAEEARVPDVPVEPEAPEGPGNSPGSGNTPQENAPQDGGEESPGSGPGNGNGNQPNSGNGGGNTGGSGPGSGNGGQEADPQTPVEGSSGGSGPGNGNGNQPNSGNGGGNTGGQGPGTGNGAQDNNPNAPVEGNSGGSGPGNGNGNQPNSGNGGGNTGGQGVGTGNGAQENNPHSVIETEEQSLLALGDLGETLTGFNIAAPSEGGDLLDLSQVLSDYGCYSISFQLIEGENDVDVAIQVSSKVRGEVVTETLAVIDGGTLLDGGNPVNPDMDFDAQTALADNLMLTVTVG